MLKVIAGVIGASAFCAVLAQGEGQTVLESSWAKVIFHNCVLSTIAVQTVC